MLTYETVTQELIYHSAFFFFNMEYVCMAQVQQKTHYNTNLNIFIPSQETKVEWK
jgi:hypothetical protein